MPRCILNLWEVYSMPPKRFYIYVFSRGSSWFRSCVNYDRLGLYRNCRCAANISQRRIITLPQLTGLTLLSQWQISRLPWPFVAVTDPAAVDETFPKFSGFSSEKSRPNDASEAWNCVLWPQKPSNWCLWGTELLVIAAKAVQMMPLRHETARYGRMQKPSKWCLWGTKLLVIAAKAVQNMPLRHETSRFCRKSRPNDASEARNFSL